jgi:RNA polymerase sigma-70 factor, ECF subfamily
LPCPRRFALCREAAGLMNARQTLERPFKRTIDQTTTSRYMNMPTPRPRTATTRERLRIPSSDTAAEDETETDIRRLCEAGDYDRAATRALSAYGGEISRFLSNRLNRQADAHDVFSMFCEDFWVGLPGFAWRCTLRGWAYTIARHSELRYAASPPRQKRAVTLSDAHALVQPETSTPPYERTDVKNRFRQIRARLGEEDQLILILRVDRDLGWKDIVHILAGPEAPTADLLRREARIRKRFQLIKERLRRWAVEDGLLPSQQAR